MPAQEKKLGRYFIAIVPPSPVYEEALALKRYFREHYNSKASLNSPPHITLHMPFRWKEDKEAELTERFEKFSSGVKPFELHLSNFNSFPPRVIFIDVVKNEILLALHKEILSFCRRELNLFNADYKDQPFHPHLTLAFRDLKKSMYTEAWQEFQSKEFSATFSVDRFVLLRHDGRIWQSFKEFEL